MADAGGYPLVEAAFLDCAQPTLTAAVDALVRQGANRVVVIPYFLMPGRHLSEDLPRIAAEASRIHDNIPIVIAESLDGHPALDRILLERALQADGETGRSS